MRKSILSVLLMFVAVMAHGQWRLGASGGGDYNFYSIDRHYQSDYHYKGVWGGTAAIFTQYNFFDWLGVRAEIEMVQKNHLFYRTLNFAGTHYTTSNTYLQLPIMTQFSFGGEKVRGFIHAGVYAGYWVYGYQKGTVTNTQSYNTYPVDEPYSFYGPRDERWDFGLAGGIGIEYRFLEHWELHAEGRCYYSFISTTHQSSVIKDYRYNTPVAIQAGFAYIF